MGSKVQRQTVDLAAFPDLVVIYLGMRVNAWTGLRTLFGIAPQIRNAVDRTPDGLLLHENFLLSLIPPHLGMRQYWRDFDALEAWSRSAPHRDWWRNFLRSSGGTGFWHETYFMRGGMEAVYDDVHVPVGLGRFAPLQPARGPMFSARQRAKLAGAPPAAVVEEAELDAGNSP
jgi:fumigallin biosynthesis monooxygenase-like protein